MGAFVLNPSETFKFLFQPDTIQYAKKRHLGPLKTECHMIPDPAIPPAMPPPTKKSTGKNTAVSSDGKDSNSSDDEDNGMNYRKKCEILASDVRRRKFADIKKSIHASKLMDLWDNSSGICSVVTRNLRRKGFFPLNVLTTLD